VECFNLDVAATHSHLRLTALPDNRFSTLSGYGHSYCTLRIVKAYFANFSMLEMFLSFNG
jgi:hypothetical protein